MRDALDKLIEAVEAGTATSKAFDSALSGAWNANSAELAYNGSLDAAKALHDALLPGWMPELREWPDGLCVATIRPPYAPAFQAQGPSLARAWLLAVLRAYRQQMEDRDA